MTRFATCLLLALLSAAAIAATPFWGARTSSPVDTAPGKLKPGEWIWAGDSKTMGPMAVIVSLAEQRAYVYRNGILLGVSTTSTGKPGHETPTGVFSILQKDANHHSSKYNNAPMPYQQRLTTDGVALHAGGLPGYPESHGCVHLPSQFARLLFGASNMGMTVVVSNTGKSPEATVHPGMLQPIDPKSGGNAAMAVLDDGQPYRWEPQRSPSGQLSLVLSRSDQRLVVMRDGIEVGRARVTIRQPGQYAGTHAYIMQAGNTPGTHLPAWTAIGVPGHEGESGVSLDAAAVNGVVIPPDFVKLVVPLLTPGSVLVSTDAHILPSTTGRRQQVIDTAPPAR
ncbi:MAG TPA: L,D-transpeptidase [Thermomonas sp.]|nr:L,D-transpeptidase [Thermomonas sp.]